MEAAASAILIVVAVVIFVAWLHALVEYDPNESHCDWDCDSCPFPPDGCRELEKKQEDKRL